MGRKKRVDFFCVDVFNRAKVKEISKESALRILRGKALFLNRFKKKIERDEALIKKFQNRIKRIKVKKKRR